MFANSAIVVFGALRVKTEVCNENNVVFLSLPTEKIYEIINNRQEIEEYRLTDRQTRLILQLESANTAN